MGTHQLIYAPQCPNCMRFLGALNRTPMKNSVARIDVNTLPPQQRQHVSAVPMLILSGGITLVGTKAFEWLKDYERDVEVDSFCGGQGLAFSEIGDECGPASFSTPYSAFEPVP